MKILILYGTSYGCTEKCAFKLAENMGNDVEILNLDGNKNIGIANYDTIIIGGSIRLGRMNKSVSNFCRKYLDVLLQKKIGLFICCMNDIAQAKEYLEAGFPKELKNHAIAKGYFGGELNFEELAALERSLIRTVINIDKSISLIREDDIKEFAQIILLQEAFC